MSCQTCATCRDCKGKFVLRLYVVGQSPQALYAVQTVRRICAEQLKGHYRLEVIDLLQQPQLAEGEQIVAVPALIEQLPAPLRMVIGEMSATERVLVGLDLLPRG